MNDYDYNDKEILFLQELRKQYSVLDSYLSALENKIKHYEKGAATVYSPNKPTYTDLELKVKNFETDKQKDIDELLETRIIPLNKEVQELRADNYNLKSKNRNSENHIMMLNRMIDFAVGYISATQPHTDKHPMEVKKWLFEGFEGLKE
jgi:predicted  nucleic acid-binding Zn-ribbon protein